MSFTAIFVLIFLVAFVIVGGVVMFLSKTIDHGEARFGPDGKVISGDSQHAAPEGRARPAQRIDINKASDNE
ncbi:MAG: hypothetical protein ABJ205_03695 [Erythrobacter sp.]|uniref:hypothetical protein n=1 Tax=Erythrobacter sp. TaxID=1042 RepID=UPI00326312CF